MDTNKTYYDIFDAKDIIDEFSINIEEYLLIKEITDVKNKHIEIENSSNIRRVDITNNIGYYESSNSIKDYIRKLPNSDLIYISDDEINDDFSRPVGICIEIDFLENNTSKKIKQHDPSTIFINLPVKRPICDVDEPGGYSPSYKYLTPQQRWKYLNWLSNISNPIGFDYIFIYYIGLEIQLLFGNFEKAFDEIMKLKKYHSGKSFNSYSDSALFNACVYRRRFEKLKEITGGINNIQILVLIASCKFKQELSLKQTIQLFNKTRGLNRKYMNENYQLFINILPSFHPET